ncbi:MAG: IS91 family transposase [Bacteroidetes bacterium]|nr:IS91 family transposase [Bacteroidota bacterium]
MRRPPFEVAEILADIWEEIRIDPKYNTHQIRMLNAIRLCRTSALGGHIDQCNGCGHIRISYNSCRNRHCPKCQGANREAWIADQHEKLLPVKYFHVVFTLPDILNGLALAYPKQIYSTLFKAAWETIRLFAKDKKHLGAKTGMTSILHTWGQNLSLHPHLHCIIPGGGITESGIWKSANGKGRFLFPVKAMSPVFRAKYVYFLRKEAKRQNIHIDQTIFDQLFAKNWVVYAKQPFLGPAQIIEYLGRYTHKVAISNHRIVNVDKQIVRFRYKDYRQAGKVKIIPLNKYEFVRRFSLHILPLRFVRIRHYGILNAKNKEVLQRIREQLINDPDIIDGIPTETTNTKPGNYYPNQCPLCKNGTMQIMAFFDCRGPPIELLELIIN